MRILDNNALGHILENRITIKGTFYITPDILEEFEVLDNKLPPNVQNIFGESWFNAASFLVNYQAVLNRRRGRSFYNMTGFGDTSILALLKTRKESFVDILPGMTDEHIVITNDQELTRFIKEEFNDISNEFDQKLTVVACSKFSW